MALTPQHTYQIVTKRPNRMRAPAAREGDQLKSLTGPVCSATGEADVV